MLLHLCTDNVVINFKIAFSDSNSLLKRHVVRQYHIKISHFLPKLSYFTSTLSYLHQTYAILPYNSTHIQKLLLRVSNLCSLIQITHKKICFKPVMYENKPFSTKIRLFYVKTRLFFFKIMSFFHVTPPMHRH